jgi:beta-lactamase regulating signal transducer with metallopeptidase domain
MNLLQMSIQGAILVAVIVIVRQFLRYKLPKGTFVALWWVAILRLLLPFQLPSVYSVYTLLRRVFTLYTVTARDRCDRQRRQSCKRCKYSSSFHYYFFHYSCFGRNSRRTAGRNCD